MKLIGVCNMKMFLFGILILGCFAIVGFTEDPCTTEGLSANCMEKG